MVSVTVSRSGIEKNLTAGGNPFQDAPEGMSPIGDSGWYSSPDVVDPRDCNWYPDSPWCGGQPFTNSPFELEITPTINKCGFTIEFGGALGYVKLPNHAVSYRYEGECRREDPPPPKPGGTKPPQPLNGFDGRKFDTNTIYQFFVGYSTGWENSVSYISPSDVIDERKLIAYKGTYYYTSYTWGIKGFTYSKANGLRQDYAVSLAMADNKINCDTYYLRADGSCWGRRDDYDNRTYYYDYDGELSNVPIGTAIDSFQGLAYGVGGNLTNIYYAKYSQLLKYCTWVLNQPLDTVNNPGAWQAWYLLDYRPKPLPYAQNPPDPQPPRRCCMQCCTSNPQQQQQQDYGDLLRQILAECKKANKAIGSDLFPATFPAKLASSSSGNITINNLAELGKQQVLYSDELIGEYPVKIKIEDTDAVQEGNQSETLEFGNTSEILAESFGALMNIAIDTNTLVQLSTKNLIETGITRKQVHNLQSLVNALIAHTGFEHQEKYENVPFTFTVPDANNLNNLTLSDFCKESTQKIEVVKFTGKTTYEEDRTVLKNINGMLKAVFFRAVGKSAADVAGAIKDIIKKQSDAADKIATDAGTEADLNAWIEDFEGGYSGYTGGTETRDPAKPYGLPLESRPRVRIIRKPGDPPPAT